jgi:hypothetical protein
VKDGAGYRVADPRCGDLCARAGRARGGNSQVSPVRIQKKFSATFPIIYNPMITEGRIHAIIQTPQQIKVKTQKAKIEGKGLRQKQ